MSFESSIVTLLTSDGDPKRGMVLDIPDPLERVSWTDALQGHIDYLRNKFIPDMPAEKTGMILKEGHQWKVSHLAYGGVVVLRTPLLIVIKHRSLGSCASSRSGKGCWTISKKPPTQTR